MLCSIENKHDKKRVFCSFIYAANTGKEMQLLWKELEMFKAIIQRNPWGYISHVVLTIPQAMKKKPKAFRFANFITEKPEFLPIVKEGWKVEKKLQEAQVLVDSQPYNNQIKEAAINILREYHEVVINEHKLLLQKAKFEWLCEGDKNNAYFHKVIKGKKQRNKILSILDKSGNMMEGDDMAKQFVDHYKEFWVKKSKEVTNQEIKTAMFDIGANKASGPNGYTSRFSKNAWHIVGEDVCKAVKEFFASRKLLGEINATIITLVPKIENAKTVGRQIQDNIIIAQELLKGYNRKSGPKRCSLKIDIAKAYDTKNWEFLRKILTLFRFHERMVHWIVTCVTSISFSICVNGEIQGYFKGGRGLRQGDPISSYLFTLVMEVFTLLLAKNIQNVHEFKYHVGCVALKITNLCFTDDLLVLCHGDVDSVGVINRDQASILNILPFQVRKLIVKYLRVPLITKRLGLDNCKQLLDKVKMKGVLSRTLEESLKVSFGIKVVKMMHNGKWLWPRDYIGKFYELKHIPASMITDNRDKEVWKTNNGNCPDFTNKIA
ncbi:RNA-directed DNA polymerase, eukaryota, reverse transcriptase zinc-binding domain protein [Tanacetum coccineum]